MNLIASEPTLFSFYVLFVLAMTTVQIKQTEW